MPTKKKLTKQLLRPRRYRTPARSAPPGSSPGLLSPNPAHHPTEIRLLGYGPEGYDETILEKLEDVDRYLAQWPVVWINVIGLRDIEHIEKLGARFGLHRLVLEDIVNTDHRPKIEDYDTYLFTIVKKGHYAELFETEQVSIVLQEKLLITFQEKPGNSFELVCERIRRGSGKIRQNGTDYLNYALIDAVVDGYFPILDAINLRLETIESEIISAQGKNTIQNIHHAKSDLLFLHRAIWPMRDIIKILSNEENLYGSPGTLHYLRDCYDQCVQVTELTEFYRDVATGLMNTYLAHAGHRMNEIMKVLTMISALFIPLSFIASLYGMNFHYMPELDWIWGYPVALGLMASVAIVMLLMFRRRGWF